MKERPTPEAARAALHTMMKERAFEEREVTLSSGLKSNFYFDSKQVTLDAVGHVYVGRLIHDAVVAYEERSGHTIGAVGGLTLGADPIASAASMTSALLDDPRPAFIVRKEAKGHGTGRYIEGMKHVADGIEVAILEDVVTTGASSLKAVERVREAGYVVRLVIGLVDRLEGGRANLEAADVELVTLFDRSDFLQTTTV
ncbi:MAG: orotate phosphoribosyltransferase [Deltaproteobacteria bacterium]